MADTPPFSPLVPGFEFLQNLVKNAGSAMPAMGQWIAPTLNPEELEKRIGELRTVQFWLEQNARLLATTIQALEVQRMTLSTLKTMNVQMGDLRDSLQARTPATPPAPAAESPPAAPPTDTDAHAGSRAKATAPPAVDPVQWWGALTKQFSQLATSALADLPAAPAAAKDSAPAAKAAARKAAPRKKTAAPAKRAAPKR